MTRTTIELRPGAKARAAGPQGAVRMSSPAPSKRRRISPIRITPRKKSAAKPLSTPEKSKPFWQAFADRTRPLVCGAFGPAGESSGPPRVWRTVSYSWPHRSCLLSFAWQPLPLGSIRFLASAGTSHHPVPAGRNRGLGSGGPGPCHASFRAAERSYSSLGIGLPSAPARSSCTSSSGFHSFPTKILRRRPFLSTTTVRRL